MAEEAEDEGADEEEKERKDLNQKVTLELPSMSIIVSSSLKRKCQWTRSKTRWAAGKPWRYLDEKEKMGSFNLEIYRDMSTVGERIIELKREPPCRWRG